jgi:hypothetical protein
MLAVKVEEAEGSLAAEEQVEGEARNNIKVNSKWYNFSMELTYKKPSFKNSFVYLLIILLFLAAGASFYLYKKTLDLKEFSQVQAQPQNETADLIARVSKIILLPEGEVPTIATVSNPEELRSQPFFAKAKVGDKVLLYQIAKKAYLYDPEANKIIEVSSITPENSGK